MDCDETIGYARKCPENVKPFVGKKFFSVDDGIAFYRLYADFYGFDVRLGTFRTHTDGTVVHRYLVCSREGEKEPNLSAKRLRRICRVGCMARVVLKFNGPGGYCISIFNEAHNHELVPDVYKQFMKSRRMFDASHKMFALNCFRGGILASKSYALFKELVGSHENVGCSKVDFKNFARDLRASVAGVDAQIVLDNLECRRNNNPDFIYSYDVDDNNKLTRLFWCDNAAVEYFKAFGDVVSFGATYSTNKYNMIFAPFTGKDNHGKCVTFGAGLLNHEDVLSYSWLLHKFHEAMNNMAPGIIITDQDPALKIAVENVFPRPVTRHRYCMWHIMLKLADKLPSNLRGNEQFTKRFHSLVWANNTHVDVFENGWNQIMIDFGLLAHKWFPTMFDLRSYWIPAYFRDCAMSGLFRTTSMSESQNSMFQWYLKKDSNLIEFFMHYASAVDSQRHEHKHFSGLDAISSPELSTQHPMEKHASLVYTQSIFKKVQREFVGAHYNCCMVLISEVDGGMIYTVDDTVFGDIVLVKFLSEEDSFVCDCNYFVRKGIPCKHLLAVFKNRRFECIPDKYLVRRWMKHASIDIDTAPLIGNDSSNKRSQLFIGAYKCIGIVDGDSDLSNELVEEFRKLALKFSAKTANTNGVSSNRKSFELFYGGSISDNAEVLSPNPVKTKGSGSRMKSRLEKAAITASTAKRKCRRCNQLVNHDSRNCPMIEEES